MIPLYQLFMYTQCGWCDSLLLFVVHNYFNAYVSITKLLSFRYYYDKVLLKWFPDLVRFRFQGGFSFLTMLR